MLLNCPSLLSEGVLLHAGDCILFIAFVVLIVIQIVCRDAVFGTLVCYFLGSEK